MEEPAGGHAEHQLIYHCAIALDWLSAQASGEYSISSRGRTLEQEGFVHASYASQVPGVLDRFYPDLIDPLLLLTIDPGRLRVPVVAENLMGGSELFPHIYGPIPVDAVTAVTELTLGPAGWRWIDGR